MSVRLCRWGGSTGLRLPVQILEAAGLGPGRLVTLRVLDNGDIRVRPVGRAAPAEPSTPTDHAKRKGGQRRSDEW